MIDLNATHSEELNQGNGALVVGADQTGTEAGADDNAENDEFAELFADDNADEADGEDDSTEDTDELFNDELPDGEAEIKAEAKPENVATQEPEKPAVEASSELVFPKDIVPGTIEYIQRIDQEAREMVKKQLGLTDDTFDPEFDTKHRFALDRAARKLDVAAEQFYANQRQQVAEKERIQAAMNVADQECEKLLSTPELKEKFLDAIDNRLTARQARELQAKANSGDYSGFLAVARRVAGLQEKVETVNNRPAQNQQPTRQQQRRMEITDGGDDDGVAGLLGL